MLRRLGREQVSLHRRPQGDHFVGIDVRERLQAEQLAHVASHRRDPRRAAHQDDAVEALAAGHARVLQRPPDGPARLLDQWPDRCLQLPAVDPPSHRVGHVDAGQVLLRLPRRIDRLAHLVRGPVLPAEEDLGESAIEIVAAQRGVAAHRLHLEHPLVELKDGDVEGPAAQVVDGERSLGAFVEAVGEGRRSGLVEQPQDFQSGEASGLLRGLPLRIVEVGGYRDHRLVDLDPEPLFRARAQRAQHLGRDLHRIDHAAARDHEPDHAGNPLRESIGAQTAGLGVRRRAAHEPLHRGDGIAGELRGEPAGRAPDHDRSRPAAGPVVHDRRKQCAPLVDRKRVRLAVGKDDGDERVGSAEIDPDCAGRASLLGAAFARLADLQKGHQSSTERPSTSSR